MVRQITLFVLFVALVHVHCGRRGGGGKLSTRGTFSLSGGGHRAGSGEEDTLGESGVQQEVCERERARCDAAAGRLGEPQVNTCQDGMPFSSFPVNKFQFAAKPIQEYAVQNDPYSMWGEAKSCQKIKEAGWCKGGQVINKKIINDKTRWPAETGNFPDLKRFGKDEDGKIKDASYVPNQGVSPTYVCCACGGGESDMEDGYISQSGSLQAIITGETNFKNVMSMYFGMYHTADGFSPLDIEILGLLPGRGSMEGQPGRFATWRVKGGMADQTAKPQGCSLVTGMQAWMCKTCNCTQMVKTKMFAEMEQGEGCDVWYASASSAIQAIFSILRAEILRSYHVKMCFNEASNYEIEHLAKSYTLLSKVKSPAKAHSPAADVKAMLSIHDPRIRMRIFDSFGSRFERMVFKRTFNSSQVATLWNAFTPQEKFINCWMKPGGHGAGVTKKDPFCWGQGSYNGYMLDIPGKDGWRSWGGNAIVWTKGPDDVQVDINNNPPPGKLGSIRDLQIWIFTQRVDQGPRRNLSCGLETCGKRFACVCPGPACPDAFNSWPLAHKKEDQKSKFAGYYLSKFLERTKFVDEPDWWNAACTPENTGSPHLGSDSDKTGLTSTPSPDSINNNAQDDAAPQQVLPPPAPPVAADSITSDQLIAMSADEKLAALKKMDANTRQKLLMGMKDGDRSKLMGSFNMMQKMQLYMALSAEEKAALAAKGIGPRI